MGALRRARRPGGGCERYLAGVPFFASGAAPLRGAPDRRPRPGLARRRRSVDPGGLRQDPRRRSRETDGPLAARIVTTSPDVTVSTNLGPWVNRRGLFARDELADTFRDERVPSAQKWRFSPRRPAHRARHRRDEPVPAAGRRGARPFAVRRAADPDRHGLRPVHRARPRCAELCLLPGRPLPDRRHAVRRHAGARGRRAPVDRHAADRHERRTASPPSSRPSSTNSPSSWTGPSTTCSATATASRDERTWLRDETGGSVYLRLSTRPLEQPARRRDDDFRRA